MTVASIIKFITSSSLNELSDAITSVVQEGAQSILLLSCSNNEYEQQKINLILTQSPLPICGAIFPKIILANQSYSQGAIILGLMIKPKIVNYTRLTDRYSDFKDYIFNKSKNIECYQNFVMLSGVSFNISEHFSNEFYDYIGSDIRAIGGRTNSLDSSSPCSIYTNQGIINDAIQVIALPCAIKNGISHGWDILDGPYLITESEGTYVHSVNYKSTFEFYRDAYRDIIKNKEESPLTQANFFALAQQFPLGIISLDEEILVRTACENNGYSLQCIGNVPVNSMVYLLKAKPGKMILANKKIAQSIAKQGRSNTVLLFDCISRDQLMGDDIKSELQAIQQYFPETYLVGAMVAGEIANTSSGSIRLLNNSTVLGAF